MANISITRRCRRQCSYCFAKHEIRRSGLLDMPPDTFARALDFLKRSRIPEARILGGEPTEHPLFCDYVEQARAAGFRILIFSGGLIPEPALTYLATLPASGFSLLLNAANPATDRPDLLLRQEQVCRVLGDRVTLGTTIFDWQQNPAYLLDWVLQRGLCRTVRVGIAQPILGGANVFFPFRHPRPIRLLESFFLAARQVGIQVGFDCGFTPCMFSRPFVEEHAALFAAPGHHAPPAYPVPGPEESREVIGAVGIRCGPVVDILPEGDAIPCYALSRTCRLPIPEQGDQSDWSAAFDRELSAILPAGCFRACASCEYRVRQMCSGGCRARRAARLRPLVSSGHTNDGGPHVADSP